MCLEVCCKVADLICANLALPTQKHRAAKTEIIPRLNSIEKLKTQTERAFHFCGFVLKSTEQQNVKDEAEITALRISFVTLTITQVKLQI